MATTKYIVDNKDEQEIDGDLAISGDLAIYGDVNIAGNTNIRPYKVFTALLTQSGVDNTLSINTGNLTIGTTYIINDFSEGMDFTNVGALNNNTGTYFVATATIPNNWGIDEGSSSILQYNTGSPIATVLENTIGNLWFNYVDIGYYKLSSESLFTNLKSTSIMQTPTDSGDRSIPGLYTTYFDGESNFFISTFKISDISAVNDYLLNTFMEIRVYN
jgi:hypothetical protein